MISGASHTPSNLAARLVAVSSSPRSFLRSSSIEMSLAKVVYFNEAQPTPDGSSDLRSASHASLTDSHLEIASENCRLWMACSIHDLSDWV